MWINKYRNKIVDYSKNKNKKTFLYPLTTVVSTFKAQHTPTQTPPTAKCCVQ